jgi:hypothetical protein
MYMKKIYLIAACLVLAFVSKAQSNTDEINFMQSTYGMQKKQLIALHMQVSKADSAKFWALYDAYEVTRKDIGKKRIANIEEYSKNYDKLTNEKTDALINTTLEVYNDFGKLWKDTYKKMAKEISPLTAGKFIQVEMYLESLVRNELSAEIPLIGEFEPKK